MKRRTFIKETGMASLVIGATPLLSCEQNSPLKILVLGGTNFVGPAVVDAAIEKHHDITLFNRGLTNPQLYSDLSLIKGDRLNGPSSYESLANQQWDVVIDVWPEHAQLVDEATSVLQNSTSHYIFISSIAVYQDFQEVGLNELSKVVTLEGDHSTWGYAEEKLAAEEYIRDRFPRNHTIIRPGPIKGWRDPALDLLYWIIKLKRDESIIAPGSGEDPIQFIDVRDVGRFALHAIDNGLYGTYNCVGPENEALIWRDLLAKMKNYLSSDTKLIWASEDFLAENKISSFSDLPLWAPLSEDRGFMQISNEKMIRSGFNYTPIEKTFEDCLRWYKTSVTNEIAFGTDKAPLGLNRKKELALINQLVN